MSAWTGETAEWYAREYGEYATNRLAVDRIDLATDATGVDVGCGNGAALGHAAGRVTDGSLIGIDPVPHMLEIAQERVVGHAVADRIQFRLGTPAGGNPAGAGWVCWRRLHASFGAISERASRRYGAHCAYVASWAS